MMESQASKNSNQAILNESQAVQNAISYHKIYELEAEVKRLKKQVDDLANERNSALKWGVIVLGGTVVGLVTWIVNFFQEHIK